MKPRTVLFLVVPAVMLISCAQPVPTAISDAAAAMITTVTRSVTGQSLAAFLALFDSERCPTTNPKGVQKAEAALVSLFQSWGYVVTKIPVTLTEAIGKDPSTGDYVWVRGPFTMNNVLAEKPGIDPSLRPVFLTAHYDTVPDTPGADDNGSGCAGVLEAARVLQGVPLLRTVRFAVFAFEEDGLAGSTAYTSSLPDAELPECVFNLETIGFTSSREGLVPVAGPLLGLPTTGDFAGAFGSSRSRALVLDCLNAAHSFVPGLNIFAASADANLSSDPFLQDILRSDQTPFWERGVPAVMFTDTANLRAGSPYHSPQDDITHIDVDFLANVVKTALATLCVRAGAEDSAPRGARQPPG